MEPKDRNGATFGLSLLLSSLSQLSRVAYTGYTVSVNATSIRVSGQLAQIRSPKFAQEPKNLAQVIRRFDDRLILILSQGQLITRRVSKKFQNQISVETIKLTAN